MCGEVRCVVCVSLCVFLRGLSCFVFFYSFWNKARFVFFGVF